ncbi:splicing factor U2AF family SnRNP auxilary factor large subunit, RRM domain-containing protein [Cryptosporidium felis]|nr:splicing factor U2AF family SnRNP auxilary factor large subunit, RRM domain-containing protein [Cryptosporidium felis]
MTNKSYSRKKYFPREKSSASLNSSRSHSTSSDRCHKEPTLKQHSRSGSVSDSKPRPKQKSRTRSRSQSVPKSRSLTNASPRWATRESRERQLDVSRGRSRDGNERAGVESRQSGNESYKLKDNNQYEKDNKLSKRHDHYYPNESESRLRSESRCRYRYKSRHGSRSRSRSKSKSRSRSKSKSRSRSRSVSVSVPKHGNRYEPSSRFNSKTRLRLRSRSISSSRSSSKSTSRSMLKHKQRARQDLNTMSINSSEPRSASNSINRDPKLRPEYHGRNDRSAGHPRNYHYYSNERGVDNYHYGEKNSRGHYSNVHASRHPNNYRERYRGGSRLSYSEERERSRERERRRRRLQAEFIKKAGGFQKLAQSEGKEPTPVFYDGFQWVAKTGSTASMDAATMNNTRRLRRLYFGNLPLNQGLTEANFQQIIWQEMVLRGLCLNPNENPILCVWFAQKKGSYGFVEFRTVEETEKALNLDGFACLGSKIKVSRPNDYSQALAATSSSASNSAPKSSSPGTHSNLPNFINLNSLLINGKITQDGAIILAHKFALQLMNSNADKNSPLGPKAPNSDSKVMRIVKPVDHTQIQDQMEYEEIRTDFCQGIVDQESIISSRIILPQDISKFERELKEANIKLEPTDILIEFTSNSNLQVCASILSVNNYDNKPLNLEFFDEKFYMKHLRQ